jgi:hypothetical protein
MTDRPPLRPKHKIVFFVGGAIILLALIIFVGMNAQYVADASR